MYLAEFDLIVWRENASQAQRFRSSVHTALDFNNSISEHGGPILVEPQSYTCYTHILFVTCVFCEIHLVYELKLNFIP